VTQASNVTRELFVLDEENDATSDTSFTEIPSDASAGPRVEEYDCVICGTSSPSTAEKTVGLVVLLQPSSGKSRAS
jgi:hypothetical protein